MNQTVNDVSGDTISENPSFKQLAFIMGILLILVAWKFGLEGILE